MADFAKVRIRGRIAGDPQLKYVGQNKTALIEFSVIVVEQRNGQRQDPMFFDCKAWTLFAEHLNENYRKGDQFRGEGKLTIEKWDDKVTGQKRSKAVIVLFTDTLDDDESKLREPAKEQPRQPTGGYRKAEPRQQTSPVRPAPADLYNDEQQFKDDDIPF